MKFLNLCLTALFIVLVGCSARTVYVPVEKEVVKTEYFDRWQQDSILLHDSIFIHAKGDTVWLEKYKTLYRTKLVRDSVVRLDSIRVDVPYPVEVVKEVNRLHHWQIFLIGLGGVAIGYIGYRLVRFFR